MRTRSLALTAIGLLTLGGCASTTPEPSNSPSTSASEEVSAAFGVELVTDALTVPREVATLTGDRLLVSDQVGRVVVIEAGEVRAEPFLDIQSAIMQPTGERLENGLAGFALAPDFETSGVFYTFTTVAPDAADPAGTVRVDTISSWRADPATLVADPASQVVMLEVPTSFPDHVGGELEFDDAGLLFASFGAATGSADAQDPTTISGSIIRIDPVGGSPYAIPADNPFVSGGGAPEVYSYGYRNPWRLDWDAELGLVVAEPMFREKDQQVSVAVAGGNAGYPAVVAAAPRCWDAGEIAAVCETTPDGVTIEPPALEYPAEFGRIVSAAVVIRDSDLAALNDSVLVTDWQDGMLMATPGETPWTFEDIATIDELDSVTLWDAQQSGDDVYVMTTTSSASSGEVYRLIAE